MTVKTSWPWIAGLIGIAAALNPFGLLVVSAAFTGEQLARTLGALLFAVGLGVIALLALIEFGIRRLMMARQRRRALGVAHG